MQFFGDRRREIRILLDPNRLNAYGLTVDQVGNAARELFRASNRTIGWFDPLPIGESLKPQGSRLTPGA